MEFQKSKLIIIFFTSSITFSTSKMAERHTSSSEDESQKIETVTISDSEDPKSSSSEADVSVSTSTESASPDICTSTTETCISNASAVSDTPSSIPTTSAVPNSEPTALVTTSAVSDSEPAASTTSAVPDSESIALTTTSAVPDSEPTALVTTSTVSDSEPAASTTSAVPESEPAASTTSAVPDSESIALTTTSAVPHSEPTATTAEVSASVSTVPVQSPVSASTSSVRDPTTVSASEYARSHPILYRLLRGLAHRNPILASYLRNPVRLQNEERLRHYNNWIYRLRTWDNEFQRLERKDMRKTLKRGVDEPGPSHTQGSPAKKPHLDSDVKEAVTSSDTQASTSDSCLAVEVPTVSASNVPDRSGNQNSTQISCGSMVQEPPRNQEILPSVSESREARSIISTFEYLLNTLSEIEDFIERPDIFSSETEVADAGTSSCCVDSERPSTSGEASALREEQSGAATIQENTVGSNSPDVNPGYYMINPPPFSAVLHAMNEIVQNLLTQCLERTEAVSNICNAQGGRRLHEEVQPRVSEILDALNYLVGLREESSTYFLECCDRNEFSGLTYILKVITQISQAYNRLLRNVLTLNDLFSGNCKRDPKSDGKKD